MHREEERSSGGQELPPQAHQRAYSMIATTCVCTNIALVLHQSLRGREREPSTSPFEGGSEREWRRRARVREQPSTRKCPLPCDDCSKARPSMFGLHPGLALGRVRPPNPSS